MGNLVFDALYVMAIVGGFCLLLVLSEVMWNFAYKYIPRFRRWADEFLDGLPDYDEESEVEAYE